MTLSKSKYVHFLKTQQLFPQPDKMSNLHPDSTI